MAADTIKLLFTYAIATVVVIGGGFMLYAIRLDPPESASSTLSLALAGFIGGALGYVFNRETATQATRAAASAYRDSQPTITTDAGPPAKITVTPPAPDEELIPPPP